MSANGEHGADWAASTNATQVHFEGAFEVE
jgi:hypothetical protein